MAYTKFSITAELRNFLARKPTKVTPDVLLMLIAEDYLTRSSK